MLLRGPAGRFKHGLCATIEEAGSRCGVKGPVFSLQLVRCDLLYKLIKLARTEIAANRCESVPYFFLELELTFKSITHGTPIFCCT
jgi:hypothetical protein